jgi:branched-chain amino acid transport system permease protein
VNERSLRLLGYAVGLVLVLVLPRLVYPVLALQILLFGLFAIAVDLLLGFVGLLSFGHAMFWGTAAYTSGYLAKTLALDYPFAMLAGACAAAVLAIPVGYLSIRRKGIYFAMVTLAFAQMVYYVANEARGITGGENGLRDITRTFLGSAINDPLTFYYYALPLVLVGYWLAYRIVHSPFGHVLVAIRDNEARAQALGYPTERYKLIAFVLSAFLAGIGGGIYSLSQGFGALELVHWTTSGTAVVMVILGGIGTLWGGLLGSAVYLLLQYWLSSVTDAWGLVTGTIFIVIVLGFRRGIWGSLVHTLRKGKIGGAVGQELAQVMGQQLGDRPDPLDGREGATPPVGASQPRVAGD